MKLKLLCLMPVLMLIQNICYGQSVNGIVPGKQKYHPFLSIGGGESWSVIDNRMEIRGAYKTGINYKIAFHTKPWFYWSAEYTHFGVHVAHPAIENIHSWNSEVSGNMLFNLGRSNLKFKTNFGLGMMEWYGTYIGPSWNDNRNYYIGMKLTDHWVYGTLGSGVEHDIGRYVSVSADFRFSFAADDFELVNISDTGFFVTVNWNVRKPLAPTPQNSASASRKKNNNNKKSRIYKWLKSR